MVDLDTNTYEKKLWLSDKQLLSEPVKSVYPMVAARNNVVYTVYSSSFPDPVGWYVYRTYSDNFGADWSAPYQIQWTGNSNAGHPFPIIFDSSASVAYDAKSQWNPPLEELMFRHESISSFLLSESTVVVGTSGSSDESLAGANLLNVLDTLFCLYLYYEDGVSHINVQKSVDSGESWLSLEADAGTAPGIPLNSLVGNGVMCIIHRAGNEVVITRSFDGGYTWTQDEYVSADDEYASQGPRAASDGNSGFHAIWWDYEGVVGGSWYGFPFYRRSLDNGETWGEIRSLTAGANTDYVDIWADTNRVYAIYNDCRWGSPDFSIFLRYSHDQGASWSEEIQLTDEIDPARRPDVYGDGDLVYMVWEEQHYPEYIWGVYYMLGVWYLPGDVDLSNEIDIADLVYMVDWMFTGGPAPIAYDAAQMDGIGSVDISDLVYMVDYMFNDGPPPVGGEGL